MYAISWWERTPATLWPTSDPDHRRTRESVAAALGGRHRQFGLRRLELPFFRRAAIAVATVDLGARSNDRPFFALDGAVVPFTPAGLARIAAAEPPAIARPSAAAWIAIAGDLTSERPRWRLLGEVNDMNIGQEDRDALREQVTPARAIRTEEGFIVEYEAMEELEVQRRTALVRRDGRIEERRRETLRTIAHAYDAGGF